MKTIKMGIFKENKGPLLPKKFVGTKVSCYGCEAKFELEAQDAFFIVGHLNFGGSLKNSSTDEIVYIKCTHCGYDMRVGKKD